MSFQIGDLVAVRRDLAVGTQHAGVVYRVTKLPAGARGVNYVLANESNPTGRGLRAAADQLEAHDPDATPTTGARVTVFDLDTTPIPESGSVVKIEGPGWREDASVLWVVLSESRKGGVKVTRLGGGSAGRYYPHVPMALVTVIPLSDLAANLPA